MYESTSRAIIVAKASVSLRCRHWHWLKSLVKVFKRLCLLNLWMEVVHTCPDVGYWSEVLCCIITTHMSDHGVKVTDLEKKICLYLNLSVRQNVIQASCVVLRQLLFFVSKSIVLDKALFFCSLGDNCTEM